MGGSGNNELIVSDDELVLRDDDGEPQKLSILI